MHFIKKFLILVIVIVATIIVYSLFKNSENMKKQIAQEIKKNADDAIEVAEGFDRKVIVAEGFDQQSIAADMTKLNDAASGLGRGLNIKPVSKTYYNFPLKEFMIKSSYNSGIVGGSASKNAIKFVINRGCRLLDFEIYTRLNDKGVEKEYISYSEDPEYKSISTDLDLTMDDAFTTVIGNAFTSPTPSPRDPLFIHLRLKNHSHEGYRRIVKSIEANFGKKLYGGKINGSTTIGSLMDKIVIILDVTSAPDYDNYGSCINSDGAECIPLSAYIQLRSGMVNFPKYSYIDYHALISSPISIGDDGRTDVKSFYMVVPPQIGDVAAPTLNELVKQPCQMVLTKFYNQTPALKNYEEIFNICESSFCPISSFIRNSYKSNSD
jgi:hypothetical protein